MKQRELQFYICLLIISTVSFFWLISSLFHNNVWNGEFQRFDPDSILFARQLEQSILKGKILDTDNYAAFPYETKTGFAPFYMFFLVSFVNLVYFIFPNLTINPIYVAGILPIIIPFFTILLLTFSIYKLSNNKILTLFCSLGMLPGFSAMMVAGFLKLDYDYLISFFIWSWIICGAFYVKTEKHIFVYIGAVTTVFFISTWTGAPFFYFFATLYGLVIWVLNPKDKTLYIDYAFSTMFIGSIVAFIFVPRTEDTYRYFADLNVARYSYLHGLLVFIGAVFLIILTKLKNLNKPRTIGIFLFLIVTIVVFICFHETILQATGILFKSDPVHHAISELTPGINYEDIFNEGQKNILFRFTPIILLFPICFIFKIKNNIIKFILYWLLLLFSLSAFYQVRYIRWLGCGYGLIIGFSLFFLWKAITNSIKRKTLKEAVIALLPIILAILCINFLNISSSDNLDKEDIDVYTWIKDNTLPTSGYIDNNKPEYAVLAYWDQGNKITYYAKRPVAVSNSLWGYKTMADIFSAETEKDSFYLCKKYKMRYILIETSKIIDKLILSFWPLLKSMPETSEYKLYYGNVPERDRFVYFYFWLSEHLGLTPLGKFEASNHFRIVFANENDGKVISKYLLFQTVEGAICNFKTEPNSKVSLSMEFKVGEMPFIYKRTVNSDENGDSQIILPYSNSYKNGNITTDSFYKVSIEKDKRKSFAKLFISNEDVEKGNIIALDKQMEYVK